MHNQGESWKGYQMDDKHIFHWMFAPTYILQQMD